MKKLLLAALFVFVTGLGHSFAQVTYAKPQDYNSIFKKTLAVELLEENSKAIQKLEKQKKKNPNGVENYKSFIKKYNALIKKCVDKYWTLNEKIEYKKTFEINKIQKAKSKKYVCLYYTESKHSYDPTEPMAYRSPLTVPTYNYNRAESSKVKVDYSFFMPLKLNEKNSINEYDIIFSLQFMQANLKEIQKTGKKINAKKFAKVQSEKNCKLLSSKTLLIDKTLLHKKATEAEIKTTYSSKFEIVSPSQIDEAVKSSSSNKAYTVAIPTGLATGSAGPLSASRVMAMRLIVDAKTGLVYGCIGASMGEFNDANYRVSDFKKYNSCK